MDKIIYIPTPVAVPFLFFEWPVILLVATTILGEAAGEPMTGKIAVGWVIQNRVNKGGWFGKNFHAVILKPKQFSCFGDVNKKKMRNPLKYESFKTWRDCYEAARLVLEKKVEDPVSGATSYHRADIEPYWAKGMEFTKQIGAHKFYRTKNG